MTNNQKIKVSVILPVYNVEGYIEKCIQSLQSQSLSDLEFIFVDDCSTDQSMSYVEAWAKEDDRVRVIRNENNSGAGVSRNRGIEVAQGEYLSFIDPDDYISKDFYRELYTSATHSGPHDIAKGKCVNVDIAGKESKRRNQNISIHNGLEKDIPLYRVFRDEHWSAIYRKVLFENGLRYGLSRKGQDTTFLLSCGLMTNDIVINEKAIYYYLQREDSAVNTYTPQRFHRQLDSEEEKFQILNQIETDEYVRKYISIRIHFVLAKFYEGIKKDTNLETNISEIQNRLRDIVEKNGCCKYVREDSLAYCVFEDKQVLLPKLDFLREKEKYEGAVQWIEYLEENDITERRYLYESIQPIGYAIVYGKKNGYYHKIMKRIHRLPIGKQIGLLRYLHRCICKSFVLSLIQ